MESDDLEHLEALREAHQKRLRSLELKEALYGLDTPPQILIEMTDIRTRIVQLGNKIAQLRAVQTVPSNRRSANPSKQSSQSAFVPNKSNQYSLEDNFQFKRPYRFILQGQVYDHVVTWRQVYGLVCQHLSQYNAEEFAALPQNTIFIGKQGTKYFSTNSGELRAPQLVAQGVYIESNLSANNIREQIKKLLNEFKIDRREFVVYMREERGKKGVGT